MNARKRLAIEAMLDSFSELHVYVDRDGREDGMAEHYGHPKPGSGAILHDCVDASSPIRISRKIVAGLRLYGTTWDPLQKCEVFTDEGRVRARAAFHGRDIIWVGSPGAILTTVAQESRHDER